MHLYIATRGQKDLVDNMINDLQAQYVPYQVSPHDVIPKLPVQVGVRPLQLWELAFPEDSLGIMLSTLEGSEFRANDERIIPRFLNMILKIKGVLGLKDVPKEYDKSKKFIIRRHPHIDIKYLGIKKDEYGKVELV